MSGGMVTSVGGTLQHHDSKHLVDLHDDFCLSVLILDPGAAEEHRTETDQSEDNPSCRQGQV